MTNAKRAAEYLKECGIFYLATADGIRPSLRPVREVCLFEDALYFLFMKEDDIYGQLLNNDSGEICAVHPDQSMIRISCRLREEKGKEAREATIKLCEESLENICPKGTKTVFRMDSGRAVITDFTGKTEEFNI